MGCMYLKTKVTQDNAKDIALAPLERFEQFIKSELKLSCKTEADYYRAINHFFGDGTMLIPRKYYDEADTNSPKLKHLRSGRSRSEFLPEEGGLGKYHHILTIVMPDDQVHVVIINDVVVPNNYYDD